MGNQCVLGFVVVLGVLGIHFWCQTDFGEHNLKRNKREENIFRQQPGIEEPEQIWE